GQATRVRVASPDRPVIGSALHHSGDDVKIDALVTSIEMLVDTGKQPIFQVGHNPGTIASTEAPHFDIAEVDRFHMAVAGIVVARLGVAVIEAASAIEVRAVEDGVLALGIVAGRDARGMIVAVSGARSDKDAIDVVTADRHGQRGRVGQIIWAASGPATWCLSEIVTTPGLVIDDGDDAGCACTE